MKQKKGKMHIILPVLVVAVILVFYFFNFRIGSYPVSYTHLTLPTTPYV